MDKTALLDWLESRIVALETELRGVREKIKREPDEYDLELYLEDELFLNCKLEELYFIFEHVEKDE